MKSARFIIRKYINPEECDISISLLERMMDEYANQFKSVEHRNLDFDSYKLIMICEEVCCFFGISKVEFSSKSRKRRLTDARAIYARRARLLYPDVSWSDIGALMQKDHASALQACRRAYEVKEIQSKYNRCYADQTKIAYAVMASVGGTGLKSIAHTKQGSVLSYGKMEKRKPVLQGYESALCGMSDEGHCRSGSHCRPHNPEGQMC